MTKTLKKISLCVWILSLWACGTTKNQPQRPMESYQPTAEAPPSVSTVNIPLRLSSGEIERLLNYKLNGTIYEDKNLDDDGLMMRAVKSQHINIWFQGTEMRYRVPMHLWVFKKIIGNRGIEAEGEIALMFKTNVNIKPDWSIDPKTELVSYDWIKNMGVKTGLGNIDVKYIANIIIDRSKATLTTSIDQQIASQMQIRSSLDEAWQMMQQPVPITSSYGTWWVKLTPQSVAVTPLRQNGDKLESIISATSFAEVVAGEKQPTFRPNSFLPQFQWGSAQQNDFNVSLTTDIPIKEAEQLAKSFAVGQTFNPGGKQITVKDIQLFGQNDKIVVNTSFTGSYTGSLYLIGRPVFNVNKNTIEMEDLDYDLNTKSFLINSAKWLFDKTILNKMKEACVFPLDENVKYFKTMMNDQLRNYQFNKNVVLRGAVDDIKVDKIAVQQGNIKVYISSKGTLNLDVNGIDGF